MLCGFFFRFHSILKLSAFYLFPEFFSMKFTRVAVHLLVERNGRILFGKRKNNFGNGTWALPCVKLEFGERLDDCAKRELLEETGLNCSGFELVCLSTTAPGVYENSQETEEHFVVVGFKALNSLGEPSNLEPEKCEGWQWFDKTDLPEPLFFSSKPILDCYLTGKIFV
jgi:8-oxo-dGTP diphosphatase